ncbi:MAG: glycerate 2-kinase [Solirubrobacteraceae bacterium]|nr:glycerate 2-kinase [Solirubrobacteraceae bacterium]
MMSRFLIAPDAFKGTFSAAEVAAAIARGVRAAGAEAEECPVADGGEGTVDVLLDPLGGEQRAAICQDPLGRPIEARWAWVARTRTALLEMASVSGLALVAPAERDAEAASSAGTGELLLAAREAGAREAILAIGGTATSDGGAGALGVIAQAGGLGSMRVVLACDVRVPFELAAVVFGPQKGASPAAVTRLTARLRSLADELPRDPRGIAMTGAGGGLAGALWAVHGAELCGGAPFVLATLDFAARLERASAVVVGEGCLDAQTRQGKIAGEILARAGATPVHAIVGSVDREAVEREWGGLSSVRVAGSVAELEAAGADLAERTATRL